MENFKNGKVSLLNGDCMDYLRSLPDDAFDLAIVDPPYGIGESGDRNKSRGKLATAKDYKAFSGGDKSAPDPEYFVELSRVSKNQIIWGANHFADRLVSPSSPCWIVWDKQTGESDFADCELAYASFKTAVRKFTFRWSGMLQGCMKNKEVRIHPTQKPVKLYEWLLSNYAKEGDRILDTHLGSGSSAIAAHYAGYEFVGIEMHPDYYASAIDRFQRETSQMSFL
jgi:site-specific DNA-methyltransferase (adenine-specific)